MYSKKGYDNVSFFYDALARLVFGKQQLHAQEFLIQHIPRGSKVLIVGGGSGWILEAIGKRHPSGLDITYIDASAKMIALAKQKNASGNQVTFIADTVEHAALERVSYDVVITPFLFDNFTQPICEQVFAKLHDALKRNGTWLFADFQNANSLVHQLLLKTMYLFFRIATGINARQLPDTEKLFAGLGYRTIEHQYFLNGFIVAAVNSGFNN